MRVRSAAPPARRLATLPERGNGLYPKSLAPEQLNLWQLNESAMPRLLRQFSSFVAAGFVATGVHYAVLIGLVEIAGVSAVAAALAGYGAGGIVSYGLNRRHVFRSQAPHNEAISRFALVAAVGFGLTYLFMSALIDLASLPYLAAQIATTGIVMLWSFAAHRLWTFPAPRTGQPFAPGEDRRSRPPRERR